MIPLDNAIQDLQHRSKATIPRAAVGAMNRCAYLARQELVSSFSKQFKSRNNFVGKQMMYRPTKLTEWPKLWVRVGSRFKAMEYQLAGGTKESSQPTWIGVPMRGLEAATRRGKMPQQLLKKNGYKIAKTLKGYLLIYRPKLTKKPRKQRKLAGKPVEAIKSKVIYGLHQQVHFRPRWNLGTVAIEVYEGSYQKIFHTSIY